MFVNVCNKRTTKESFYSSLIHSHRLKKMTLSYNMINRHSAKNKNNTKHKKKNSYKDREDVYNTYFYELPGKTNEILVSVKTENCYQDKLFQFKRNLM